MGSEWQTLADALAALNPISLFLQLLSFMAALLNQWFAGTGLYFQAV